MSDVDYIMKMLPDYYDFERMVRHQDNINGTYDQFVKHNLKIISDLPADDLGFLRRLCGIIKTTRLNLVDMESCAEFHSEGIYYNYKSELCIFNPRWKSKEKSIF